MPRRDAAGQVSLQSRALDSGQSRPAGADRSLFSTVAVAGSTPADAPQAVAALRTAMLRLVHSLPCPPAAIREAFAENRPHAVAIAIAKSRLNLPPECCKYSGL